MTITAPAWVLMVPLWVAMLACGTRLLLRYGEAERLRAAIRRHRDYRGDDRCYLDDRELYAVLPEGYTPPARDSAVTLEQCEKYIRCRHDPATEYVSPQRRVEELEAEVSRLRRDLADCRRVCETLAARAAAQGEAHDPAHCPYTDGGMAPPG